MSEGRFLQLRRAQRLLATLLSIGALLLIGISSTTDVGASLLPELNEGQAWANRALALLWRSAIIAAATACLYVPIAAGMRATITGGRADAPPLAQRAHPRELHVGLGCLLSVGFITLVATCVLLVLAALTKV